MDSSHVAALQAKHEGLERRLHEELNRPAPDSSMIQTLKKQKLRIKEELSFGRPGRRFPSRLREGRELASYAKRRICDRRTL